MAVTAYKTYSAGEVLTAADLNASFSQLHDNGTDVAFPLTKAVSAGDFVVTALGNATTDTGAANLRNIAILAKSVCDLRLTLTTAVPVTTADVTAAETLYWTPYRGNAVGLYDGTRWHIRTTSEISIDVPDVTGVHDVFVYDNAGTATLEVLVWTNDTTRATALAYQDGVLVKSGDATRRYIGTFYSTVAGNGQIEDSVANRYLWNYYNRVVRQMRVLGSSTWNYTTATYRQANADTANQLNFVIGYDEDIVSSFVSMWAENNTVPCQVSVGIGLDVTNGNHASCVGGSVELQVAGGALNTYGSLEVFPGVGKHFLAWLEVSTATGTTAWTPAPGGFSHGGISGKVIG